MAVRSYVYVVVERDGVHVFASQWRLRVTFDRHAIADNLLLLAREHPGERITGTGDFALYYTGVLA